MNGVTLTRTDDQRDVTVVCEHGTSRLSDADLAGTWSDSDLIAQATAYHAVDYRDCRCSFDQDDTASAEDDGIEHKRPVMFPPLAMQLAAQRLMAAARANELDVDDPGLRRDARVVQWFRRQCDRPDAS